jgi:peptidyl-prolyl cis-trans isomerase A (cyclophilin A)
MTLFLLGCTAVLGVGALMMTDAMAAGPATGPAVVVLETTLGPITLELDRERAPITVDNFLRYVDEGFYDNLIFHRVIDGFMIQGGGFDDMMREKGTHEAIKNEAKNGLSNRRGTIAMARTNDPDSATAQFYINLVDNAQGLDPRPGSAGYTVFGRVIAGMENVDAIAKVPTGSRAGHQDVPLKPVTITGARRKAK